MKVVLNLAAAILFATASSHAVGQDHIINGQSIAGGEVSAVRDRCKELQAQQGTTGTQEPETSTADTNGDQSVQDNLFGPDGAIDLDSVTLANCQEAGLTSHDAD